MICERGVLEVEIEDGTWVVVNREKGSWDENKTGVEGSIRDSQTMASEAVRGLWNSAEKNRLTVDKN